MPYQFAYSVSDSASYNEYGHQETSDGNLVKGEYHVLLPDGRTQIVSYYVEGDSGFVAEVRYEGEAQYQEKNKPYEHTLSFQSKSPVGPSYYPTQTVTYSPKVNIYHHPSEIPKINNEESIGSRDYPSKPSYQRPANNKTSSSQDISSNLVTSSIDELKGRPLGVNKPIPSYQNKPSDSENFHGRPHDGYTPYEQPAHAIRPPVYDQHSGVYSPLPEKDHGEYHESDRYRYHDGYTIHHQPPSDAIYRSVSPHTRPIHYYADPYSHYHQHDDRFYVEEAHRPSILPHEGYSHHYGHSALMEHPHYPNTYVHIEYPTVQGYSRPSDHHPLLSLGSIPHQQFNSYGYTASLDKNKSKRRI